MKKIEAMVEPHSVRAIRQALFGIGVRKMTMLEAKAIGKQKGFEQVYRGVRFQQEYLSKVKMELVVSDHLAEAVIASIITTDHTVRLADGDILISNVEEVARVRAEEIEANAA